MKKYHPTFSRINAELEALEMADDELGKAIGDLETRIEKLENPMLVIDTETGPPDTVSYSGQTIKKSELKRLHKLNSSLYQMLIEERRRSQTAQNARDEARRERDAVREAVKLLMRVLDTRDILAEDAVMVAVRSEDYEQLARVLSAVEERKSNEG